MIRTHKERLGFWIKMD